MEYSAIYVSNLKLLVQLLRLEEARRMVTKRNADFSSSTVTFLSSDPILVSPRK
jgi:hypothetical protein